ncbi:MAG TPA: hypothetical protein VFW71_16750 [Actinomycetota bacterium]|nr:hypothetical protein [Actinomycetota bacterium]
MSSALTKTTLTFLGSHSFVRASGWVAVVVLTLLIILLVEKEAVRAVVRSGPPSARRIFDVAALPLLLTLAIVVIQRFRVIG